MEVGALMPEDSGGEHDLSPQQVEAARAESRRPLPRHRTVVAARARARGKGFQWGAGGAVK
eukprot:12077558-Alexandrium_andersonii.AAC.2